MQVIRHNHPVPQSTRNAPVGMCRQHQHTPPGRRRVPTNGKGEGPCEGENVAASVEGSAQGQTHAQGEAAPEGALGLLALPPAQAPAPWPRRSAAGAGCPPSSSAQEAHQPLAWRPSYRCYGSRAGCDGLAGLRMSAWSMEAQQQRSAAEAVAGTPRTLPQGCHAANQPPTACIHAA